MSAAAVCLTTIAAIVAVGVTVGFLAGAGRRMDLEQWTVGGRGFGTILVFVLMAGEVYTTFSFLGASGWAYSRGGPTLYVLAYLTLAYVISFFFLPQVWELGRRHGMQTLSDFFSVVYGNRYLAAFACLVAIVCLVPYVQLQITGVGIILSVASFEGIGRTPAMAICVVLLVAFVFARGVRAVAWVSVVKDALMLLAAVCIGIGVPYVHFGGIGPMFAALAQARPEHLTMPGATPNLGHAWYISTVILTSVGFYMWPHSFGSTFTAKSADTLRRNAVVMPLYTLTLAFMLFAGFASVLLVPRLANGDLAMLIAVRGTFPPWLMGVIGGAGALTAMVPASIFILSAAIRQESGPAAVCAPTKRCPGSQPRAHDGPCARCHRPVPGHLQLGNPGLAVAGRLCRRGPVLPGCHSWALLEASDRAGSVLRHGCRCVHRGVPDAHSPGSSVRRECWIPGVVPQLCGHRGCESPAWSVGSCGCRSSSEGLTNASRRCRSSARAAPGYPHAPRAGLRGTTDFRPDCDDSHRVGRSHPPRPGKDGGRRSAEERQFRQGSGVARGHGCAAGDGAQHVRAREQAPRENACLRP
jgi:solute:Na+ symporter, SSS family